MRSNVYISHRGIEALLTAVQKEGFPTNFTKSSQLRARNHVASTPVATYGKLVEPIELPLKRKGQDPSRVDPKSTGGAVRCYK